MSTLLHTHVALIILTACATLDAGCVIGQIIADILIMKGKSICMKQIIFLQDIFLFELDGKKLASEFMT